MRAVFLTLIASLWLASPAHAQPSARERTQLSPRELARTARRDLETVHRDLESRLLFDQVIRDRRGWSVGIPGRPIGSSVPGLCLREFVTLVYVLSRAPGPAPHILPGGVLSGPRNDPRDIPLRPVGSRVQRQYFFVAPPDEGLVGVDRARDRERLDSACSVTLTREAGWFVAENDSDVTLGVRALRNAATAVARGAVSLECDPASVGDHTTCGAELERVSTDLRALRAIRISTDDAGFTAVVETDLTTLTIVSAFGGQPVRSIRMSPTEVLIQE